MNAHNKIWTAVVVGGWIALFVVALFAERHGIPPMAPYWLR